MFSIRGHIRRIIRNYSRNHLFGRVIRFFRPHDQTYTHLDDGVQISTQIQLSEMDKPFLANENVPFAFDTDSESPPEEEEELVKKERNPRDLIATVAIVLVKFGDAVEIFLPGVITQQVPLTLSLSETVTPDPNTSSNTSSQA